MTTTPEASLAVAEVTYDNAAFQNTDDADTITVLAAARHCANSWDGSARLLGNVRAQDIARACNSAIEALSATPTDTSAGERVIVQPSIATKPTSSRTEASATELTVSTSYTDEDLLRRAIRGARGRGYRRGQWHPRWVGVMDSFGLGSTFSHQLCRRFHFDPDEQVSR